MTDRSALTSRLLSSASSHCFSVLSSPSSSSEKSWPSALSFDLTSRASKSHNSAKDCRSNSGSFSFKSHVSAHSRLSCRNTGLLGVKKNPSLGRSNSHVLQQPGYRNIAPHRSSALQSLKYSKIKYCGWVELRKYCTLERDIEKTSLSFVKKPNSARGLVMKKRCAFAETCFPHYFDIAKINGASLRTDDWAPL